MAFVRSIGRWSLTALVVNAIIGAGIFGLPSELIRLLGRASAVAMLLAALMMAVILACMAEVASQFTKAGGSYLYIRTAFGRFAGLQLGWFWLLATIGGASAAANLFVQYLASIWPWAAHNVARIAIITALIAIPTVANYMSVRNGADLSSLLTVAKLLPLVLLIVSGLTHFMLHPHLPSPASRSISPGASGWLTVLLLVVFAYSGSENALAPAGEIKDPKRTVPFAIAVGLLICAAVYALFLFVIVATIGINPSDHAVADTASILLSRNGAWFVAVAVMVSTYGWIAGDNLASPRILYSFGENGDAPAFLCRLHPRFHTPTGALLAYSFLLWLLAITGTFLWLAQISGASGLILYSGVCASLIRLRRLQPKAPALRVPGGPVLAVIAIAISLTILSSLDRRQIILMAITAAIATANWWWAKRRAANKLISSVATTVPQ